MTEFASPQAEVSDEELAEVIELADEGYDLFNPLMAKLLRELQERRRAMRGEAK